MALDDLIREAKELDAEFEGIKGRLADLTARPEVLGPDAEDVRNEEVRRLESDVAKHQAAREALGERIENERNQGLRGERGLWGWVARRGRWFGVLAGVLIPPLPALSFALGPAEVDTAFFTVAAQVIPVLLVAAAIEGRMFRADGRMPALDAYYALFAIWVTIGEGAALMAVATAETSGALLGLTIAGLTGAGMFFVLFALLGPRST